MNFILGIEGLILIKMDAINMKKVNSYSDLCKKCTTPNICLDFGLFSDCLKGKKTTNNNIKMRKPQKHYVVSLPPDTDMEKLRTKIKENSLIKGKTANALIAAYILKLAK